MGSRGRASGSGGGGMPGRGGGTETETGTDPPSAGASLRLAVREAGGKAGCERWWWGGHTNTPHAVRSHEVTTSQNIVSSQQ